MAVHFTSKRYERTDNTKSDAKDELALIRQHMARPPEGSVLLSITPATAKAILDTYNIENRAFKSYKTRQLVSAMRAGDWRVTGESIKFSDRRLLDGQNRLRACAESNTPITTHVVFGVKDDAFAYIDTGASRTPGDVLSIVGVSNPNIIAHVITWINTLENFPGLRSRIQLTPSQILHLHRTVYTDAGEHVMWGRELQSATGSRTPVARGATMHYAFERFGGKTRADTFMLAWINNNPAVPQAVVLRRRINQMSNYTSGLMAVSWFYATVIKAWNLYIDGTVPVTVADLKWSEEEPFPAVHPRRDVTEVTAVEEEAVSAE